MKTKVKNLKQFKELIKVYENLTLEKIKEKHCDKEKITGFGSPDTCTLCQSVPRVKSVYPIKEPDCSYCVYGKFIEDGFNFFGCLNGENQETFNRIELADTPRKLLNAFYARAKHMRKILAKFEK
jgi:hypothetical protein